MLADTSDMLFYININNMSLADTVTHAWFGYLQSMG